MEASQDPWLRKPYKERITESIYPLLLCGCRFILSLTQFSVAVDTFVMLKELNRMNNDSFDVSLRNIADTVEPKDYDWVPTLTTPKDRGEAITTNYGTNKLFNLYIIRLSHYFRRQLGEIVICPATISLIFMTVLTVFDLYEILQSTYARAKLQRIRTWLQTSLYVFTFTLITLQLVTLLYESSEIAHMEVVYSFLFAYESRIDTLNPMLMKSGVRSLKYRLVACIIFNIASLVPDTYLILVRTIQPLRLYTIVNSMKVATGLITLGTLVMIGIMKYYILSALDPKLLGDKTSIQLIQHNPLMDINYYYPRTTNKVDMITTSSSFISQELTHLPVFSNSDQINFRLLRTIKELRLNEENYGSKDAITVTQKIVNQFENKPSPTNTNVALETNMANYAFVQSSYAQMKTALNVLLLLCVYFTISALGFGLYAFLMVIRRHKIYIYVNLIVDVVGIVWQVCNIILAVYPMETTEFFCDAGTYLPGTATLNFETNAVFTWFCRAKPIASLLFGMAIVQLAIFVSDIIVLYLLWK
ncbi:putative integral membrane protein [Babesia bovis T2Bo]|uniref:Uncharacterized protein n=1 Tax=Babesia bovis TaxID=5865 RepID=A7ATM9_BABBO|nr:putative integral membrane protein [Babesia bovis T2Bo]EDO06290.1 putative integral membrane protein [Babesia bovis T2Bo]|eukprot:XP_001609858.1 hypothetical protein [Babesia bovis T2Bo]